MKSETTQLGSWGRHMLPSYQTLVVHIHNTFLFLLYHHRYLTCKFLANNSGSTYFMKTVFTFGTTVLKNYLSLSILSMNMPFLSNIRSHNMVSHIPLVGIALDKSYHDPFVAQSDHCRKKRDRTCHL